MNDQETGGRICLPQRPGGTSSVRSEQHVAPSTPPEISGSEEIEPSVSGRDGRGIHVNSFLASLCDHGGSNDKDLKVQLGL